jgi:polyphosphate kinase 2
MSEVKAVQEEVVPENKQDTTESVSSEPASAPPVAASDKALPKAPAKAAAKNTEQKTVLKKDAVKTKGQKAVKGKPAAPQQATPGIVNLNEVAHPARKPPLKTKDYEETLSKMQIELVKLQEWIKFKRLKVVVLFEGRDAAGKGGTIKRITESLSPRVTRVAALPAPTDREQSQWYFQRYVQHLPAGGEMVLFDRSWYNRAGVERVMGFCTEDEYREFLRSCPEFERMLVRSGIILIKYWFSVSNEEQERRFQKRIFHPEKHWKLSPMDLESRARWVEYSKAKDAMFAHTDIKQAPWYVVDGDDKKRARLNVITHLLNMIDYEDLTPQPIVLPPRQDEGGYVRPPITDQTFIPEVY